jgi:proliferating cell nuclear antigen|tara:strand:+ start:361 stop:1104 length:744 start_codon:yes stop_codon:yes gene_type:complete
MKLVTIQASAFKSTFEVLKDILNDVNIYFRPDGMYVVTLDTARTSLIDMYLSADNFEEYHCDQEEIIAGINISNTFKLLKTITNNDVLKMAINSKEYMDIEIISETKKTNSKFQLKLLDINESRIEVPDVAMTTITTLPSADFQRLCRDMSNIGTDIEICRESKNIHLKCEGDFANQETTIECPDESPKITGLYSLKYLNIFTKATSMCASVQIIQEIGNRFLILKYNVANLGELKFYLATKVSEDP